MAKFLVFAGTTEGRRLIEELLGEKSGRTAPEVTACVATEYGREVLAESPASRGQNRERLRILAGRLSAEEMAALMESAGFDAAVDATHPYATAVTACIRQACDRTGTRYIRLLRERSDAEPGGEAAEAAAESGRIEPVYVSSSEEAADYLSHTEGPVLLTTGSKELAAFTKVENYRERLFARVLPMTEVVRKCTELGFAGRQLICMQGPFSYELNTAMLRQTKARYLVTKETGRAGGFDEKLRAALDLGVRLVVIGRRPEEDGTGPEEVLRQLKALCGAGVDAVEAERGADSTRGGGMPEKTAAAGPEPHQNTKEEKNEAEEKSDWFPLFTNIHKKHITVVGAGRIASRRIRTLLQFSCCLTVIAAEASEEVRAAAQAGALKLMVKKYAAADLFHVEEDCAANFVLAATDDRSCNHQIYCDCKALGIPVNVADCREESDFYFPGVARSGRLVAGITAGGQDHGLARRASARMREALAEFESEKRR